MLLADATVVGEAKQFHVQPHDPTADQKALADLAIWCNLFSPTVSLDPPDSLYLALDGVTHLYGDELQFAEYVARQFRGAGYRPRLAIANTTSAAWAVTRFSRSALKVIPESADKLLHRLPIAALRLSDKTLDQLDRLGIHQVGQLADLPRESLPSRIGKTVLKQLDRLSGDYLEPLVSHQPPPIFEQQWSLEQATSHWETIQHIVRVLLQRLAEKLARHGRGTVRFTIRFDCAPSDPLLIQVGLYRPSADADHLNHLAQMQLESVKALRAVDCVTVIATDTEPLEQSQRDLFGESLENPRELADLVERLSSRLGAERVAKPILLDDWQPEKAFGYRPLTGGGLVGDGLKSTVGIRPAGALQRPLRIFSPPPPIEVLAVIPDGPPGCFYYQGQKRITACWGPERIETAWWRGPSVKRDYYRVETESASRFWIFRRLNDGQWFLQGRFD